MNRQKPIKTLVVSSNPVVLLMVFDSIVCKQAYYHPLKSHPQWCLHHLKIPTSKKPAYGKKDGETKVDDNDCYAFWERSDGFLLWNEDSL